MGFCLRRQEVRRDFSCSRANEDSCPTMRLPLQEDMLSSEAVARKKSDNDG